MGVERFVVAAHVGRRAIGVGTTRRWNAVADRLIAQAKLTRRTLVVADAPVSTVREDARSRGLAVPVGACRAIAVPNTGQTLPVIAYDFVVVESVLAQVRNAVADSGQERRALKGLRPMAHAVGAAPEARIAPRQRDRSRGFAFQVWRGCARRFRWTRLQDPRRAKKNAAFSNAWKFDIGGQRLVWRGARARAWTIVQLYSHTD